MPYFDIIRIALTFTLKIIGLFYDKNTDVNSYEGLEKTLKVSKKHTLLYWDMVV